MIIKNFHIIVGICFLALFSSGACSFASSSAQTSKQDSNVPSMMTRIDRPKLDPNGRVFNSKTLILNKEILKNLDCSNSNGYKLVEVENHDEDEGISSYDLNIVVADEVAVKIEMPTGLEVKNFMLNSAKKTKNGFQMNTEWGGGNFHYEIQFNFRCQENNFYLYKVKKDSFSTTGFHSDEIWDKKETEETKQNLPIEKFVIKNYL